jgi:tetratricopeptide (TPR) repeat protein
MAVTLESLRKSVGKKNTNSMVFAWLADLERVAGELDKALQRVDGGLTLYPNDISARLVRAKILTQLEAYQPCVEECERIITMDPFNLAAQQLMGDAYDKLGMLAERNVCYRRLHDMDPLNTFWKEEYDVVLESTAAAAAVAAAGDSEFIMSDTTQEQGSAASPLDMSFDDESSSEPATADAGADTFEMPATADSIDSPVAEESASDENMADDPFASLAAMLPNGDAAEDSTMEDLSASLESAMDSIKTDESGTLAEEFGAEENISSSDVSSALSDMFGLDDDLEPEESTSASPFANAGTPVSDIPASIDENAQSNAASIFESASIEDKPQSIDDAFGDIFGEDELPEEKPVNEESANAEPSDTTDTDDFSTQSIESLTESPLDDGIEDKDSLDESSLFEKSAEDKPQSIDDAFGDIFGEDELPEESSGSGLFEKSASADMNLVSDEAPAEESRVEETPVEEIPAVEAPAADEPTTIDNAFDSIFGEDELPEEKPVENSKEPAAESLELPVDETPAEEKNVADLELPAEEDSFKFDDEPSLDAPALESPIDNLFADDKPSTEETPVEEAPILESPIDNLFADDTTTESEELVADIPAEDAPAVEESPVAEVPVEETPAEEVPAEEPVVQQASDSAFSVDSAFESIFGADDDLPEEKPVETAETQETEPEETVSLEEQVNQAEAELEMPEVKSEDTSDLAKEMGGAFASMFGNADDDLDLPEVSAPAAADSQEAIEQELTEAPVEESIEKAPESAQEALEEDIDKSFDNLFGKEDESDLPVEGSTAPAESVAQPEVPAQEAPAAESAQDLDSLETEVSGAFKGLFDMDDDSLPEETTPSNKGVDFLMSGDSDDEISAGLINDPDAPLDRGSHDLDESLNTRTLAEIYFDQGLYGKALEIYKDLAQKEPENEDIAARLSEVEKLYNEKFGGNA